MMVINLVSEVVIKDMVDVVITKVVDGEHQSVEMDETERIKENVTVVVVVVLVIDPQVLSSIPLGEIFECLRG